MKTSLKVELGKRSYDIVIGDGLLAGAGGLIVPLLCGRRVIVVTDSNVAGLCLPVFAKSLDKAGIVHQDIILSPGEWTKSFSELGKLLETMLEMAPDRGTTIVALGGGVIGDIAGFAASILLRGVDFIQVPTTLLAQVDSSVGGKTGVNSQYGKNLIGSFYQPRLVIADTGTLLSLPRREFLAGYAEVVKYGLICDEQFFAWLTENGQKAMAGDSMALSHIVRESCRKKADVVTRDEREAGLRAILNFGHTLGHALEAETGYGDLLLHGEAVAIGMLLAMQISVARGLCNEQDYERAKGHLLEVGLPTSPRDIQCTFNADRLIEHCYHDKKTRDGKLTFVLCEGIGKTVIVDDISRQELEALLADEL